MKNTNLIFKINKKIYFCEKNNYLIIDYLNFNIGKKILLKNVIYCFDKKIFFNNYGLNYNVCIIILKHFYIKSLSIKKKKRKNIIKKNTTYKKKSLIYIQNII
ncbi:bL21 family ribosomal protein [Candidatus Carsonella ruddii]|uniref:Putative ribosomal protein L21 n=1 Tax=Candidatus Carsonella ruddii HC isolate Thao2000 TaxID=1202538 RepID=J3TW61_CARRU|nr:bL21 family ribosomal protein [Candidatus Carsonella ruddii]AFP84000.1 putative ribosomal protein L21 [Candidatus Carsonella ruddii HC isolate Thao2000]